MEPLRRWGKRVVAVLVCLIVATIVLPSTAFASSDKTYRVHTEHGGRVNVRSGPGVKFPVVGHVRNGERVRIYCTTVNAGKVWDDISGHGRFVIDRYVKTGQTAPVAPSCKGTAPATPAGSGSVPSPAASDHVGAGSSATGSPPGPSDNTYPVLPDPGTARDGSNVTSVDCMRHYGPVYCEFGVPRVVRCWVDGIISRSPAVCLSFTHRQTSILAFADDFYVRETLKKAGCAATPGPRILRFLSPTATVCQAMVGPLIKGVGATSKAALSEQKCLGMRLSLSRDKVAGLIDLERQQDKVFRKVTCPL